ncbi:MAG: hypothetical protein WC690_01755 [bacterium]
MISIKPRLIFVALLLCAMLGACMQGGLLRSGDGGGGGGGSTLTMSDLQQVVNSRATITFAAVDGAANYQVSADGAGYSTISPDPCNAGTCTYTVPNLSTGATHNIDVRAISGNSASAPKSIAIDTTLKVARFVPDGIGKEDFNFGASIVSGDMNGDAYPDLAVTGLYSPATPTTGQVDVFSTGPDFIDANRNISPAKAISGALGSAHGASIATGRVTGGVLGDLLIGQFKGAATEYGSIFIFTAATLDSGSSFNSDTQRDYVIDSDPAPAFAGAEFSKSIAAADMNGDGCDDIITAGPKWIDNPALFDVNKGKVYHFDGCINSNIIAGAGDEIFTGAIAFAMAGNNEWNVGDFNGDGLDEVLYLRQEVAGPPATATLGFVGGGDWGTFDQDADTGAMAFNLGDIDGDGFGDFAVRFETLDAFFNQGGIVLIYKGPAPVVASPAFVIFDDLQPGFGSTVAYGDIDMDGQSEIVIGSASKISIFEGPFFDDGVDSTLPYGCSSGMIMDANADRYLDLVCGDTLYNANGGIAEGSLLVLF